MQLTEHKPEHHYFIRQVTAAGIEVVETTYTTSLIVAADHLDTTWPVSNVTELNARTIEPILDLQPELVILGTGTVQIFPQHAIMAEFIACGVGLEVMTLEAACRTFNVVMSEGRRAVAALIWNQ